MGKFNIQIQDLGIFSDVQAPQDVGTPKHVTYGPNGLIVVTYEGPLKRSAHGYVGFLDHNLNPVGFVQVGAAPVSSIAKDNGLIYVSNSRSNTLSVLNPTTQMVVRTITVNGSPQHLAAGSDLVVTPFKDKNCFAAINNDDYQKRVATNTGGYSASFDAGFGVFVLSTLDGASIYVWNPGTDTVTPNVLNAERNIGGYHETPQMVFANDGIVVAMVETTYEDGRTPNETSIAVFELDAAGNLTRTATLSPKDVSLNGYGKILISKIEGEPHIIAAGNDGVYVFGVPREGGTEDMTAPVACFKTEYPVWGICANDGSNIIFATVAGVEENGTPDGAVLKLELELA